MTRKIIACRVDDDIQKAVAAMAQHQLRRMPVVENDYKIVGITSQADMATPVGQPEETAEMVEVSDFAGHAKTGRVYGHASACFAARARTSVICSKAV